MLELTKTVKTRKAVSIGLALLMLVSLITPYALTAESAAAKTKQGPVKKNGKLYFYNSKGKPAKAGKERKVSYKGNTYYVLKDGRIRKGWNVLGKDLYCFGGKNGAMLKGKVKDGVTLLPNGKAEMSLKNKKGKKKVSLNASILYNSIRILKKRGAYNKSKAEQLRSAWSYLVKKGSIEYVKVYDTYFPKKTWVKEYANYTLKNRKGNCYGYACAFAAFAWTIGYDPYVIRGRCKGPRDHAADGFTRHCVVRINGKWYDPEYWAEYRLQYHYGASHLRYTLKNRKKPVRFKKVPGTIKSSVKTIKGNLKKIGSNYYYLDKKGNSTKGVFYIGKKLYNFDTKAKYGWSTNDKKVKELTALAKKGRKFSKLEASIGKPKKTEDDCTPEFDRTHIYKNLMVSVKTNENGDDIIVEVEARS